MAVSCVRAGSPVDAVLADLRDLGLSAFFSCQRATRRRYQLHRIHKSAERLRQADAGTRTPDPIITSKRQASQFFASVARDAGIHEGSEVPGA